MTIKLVGSSSGSVALDAPASTTSGANIEFKLPVADGTSGQVLKTDGSGNLSWVNQPSGGLEMLDVWTISSEADATSSGGDLTSNWVRANSYQATIGSAMTESSGVFTFPSTGIYEITFNAQFNYSSQYGRRYCAAYLDKVISGTSSILTQANSAIHPDTPDTYSVSRCTAYFDVTDVSTHKVQFRTRAEGSTAVITGHSDSRLKTFASFKKLGDT